MTKKQFLITNCIWVICILGLLLYKQFTFWTGTEVLLRTRPVDPWDIFRGNYVTLSYEISNEVDFSQTFNQFDGSDRIQKQQFYPGDTVYVSLELQPDGTAESTGVSSTRPPAGQLFIKGIVTYRGIEFGIESYFVPEGQGRVIERLRDGELLVRVVIDKQGNAIIRGLTFNGQPV